MTRADSSPVRDKHYSCIVPVAIKSINLLYTVPLSNLIPLRSTEAAGNPPQQDRATSEYSWGLLRESSSLFPAWNKHNKKHHPWKRSAYLLSPASKVV